MPNEKISRLRWACRRGMLELDVLLGNFLEEAFLSLVPEEQTVFMRLLGEPDPQLFAWLTGKDIPLDPDFKLLVEKIRQHAKNRHFT